ncbi:MAG: hypothetical protein LBJ00_02645 [Planctomycetaceae bacterium]|jgi:hypothetical protein|nr:hypothetical protein [Planctomycetaceae bacterium]
MLLEAILVLLSFVASDADVQQIRDEAVAIEQMAVENRLKVKSWHVELDYEAEFFDPEENHKSERGRYVYYAESGKRRRDLTRKNPDSSPGSPEIITTKEVWSDYYYFFCDGVYTDTVTSETSMIVVNVKEATDEDASFHLPIDIRVLGFSASGILFERQVTDILGSTDSLRFCGDPHATHKEVNDDILDGTPCKKTIWKLSQYRSVTTWIAPTMGYAPIRMDFNDEASKIYYKTNVQLSQYKESGIWFPVNSVFEEYEDGKLLLRETVKVNVVSLNEKLDAITFTLRGLAIPKGWPVSYLDKDDANYVWDGQNIVTETEAKYAHLLKGRPRLFRVRALLGFSVLFLLISFYCFWSIRKQSKDKS